MNFMMTLRAAAFHVQMLFSVPYDDRVSGHLPFVPSLNSDSASEMEVMKQCIP